MKLTLHIGTEKTGSTSIQRALAADRDRLAEQGVLYPRLFGSENHMEVAVAALAPGSTNELTLIELQRQGCGHAEYVNLLRKKLQEECHTGNYERLIISNEHCHSRLRDADALGRLVELLGCRPEDTSVIVYLRRQDRLAVSLHSTRIKLGGSGPLFPDGGSTDEYFRFDSLLERYSRVFRKSRISVRLYERDRLHEGDVVSDFYEAADLKFTPSQRPVANASLSLTQMLFLEQFNMRFPIIEAGKLNAARGPIFSAIHKVRHDGKFRPAQADAVNFYERFRQANEEVREKYLPELDRPTLFDEDFSDYPQHVGRTSLSTEEYMDFVEAIWRFRTHQPGQ